MSVIIKVSIQVYVQKDEIEKDPQSISGHFNPYSLQMFCLLDLNSVTQLFENMLPNIGKCKKAN